MRIDLESSVCYFRVSTDRQVTDGSAFEDYYTRFKTLGFKEEQIYSDIASGADDSRKGYLLVLARIREGIGKVYVPSFDRLTRSPVGWEGAMEDFRKAGAVLITLDGLTMKFDSPEERYMARMMAMNAALERERNQWRSLKGHEFLRLQGRALRPSFGYVKDGDHLAPNINQYKDTKLTCWQVARDIVRIFLDCGGLTQTLRILKEKYPYPKTKRIEFDNYPQDHSALRDWLSSYTIAGHTCYFPSYGSRRKLQPKHDRQKTQVIYNTHPAIATQEEAERIKQLLLNLRTTRTKPDDIINPLNRLVYCAGCGSYIGMKSSRSGGREYRYMICQSAHPGSAKTRLLQESGELPWCDRRSAYGLTLEKLEAIVINKLCEKASEIANMAFGNPISNPDSPDIEKLKEEVERYEQLSSDDPDLLPTLEIKRQRLTQLLSALPPALDTELLRRKLSAYGTDSAFWLAIPIKARADLYRDFISRITCDYGDVSVLFDF